MTSASGGKRNKKQKAHDRFVVRCQRKVCFNVMSNGVYLSPKQSLQALQSRKEAVQISLAHEDSEDLQKEHQVICDEIKICKDYLKKQAQRMANVRAMRRKTGRLENVLQNLPKLTMNEVQTVLEAAEDILVESMAARELARMDKEGAFNLPPPPPPLPPPPDTSTDEAVPSVSWWKKSFWK